MPQCRQQDLKMVRVKNNDAVPSFTIKYQIFVLVLVCCLFSGKLDNERIIHFVNLFAAPTVLRSSTVQTRRSFQEVHVSCHGGKIEKGIRRFANVKSFRRDNPQSRW